MKRIVELKFILPVFVFSLSNRLWLFLAFLLLTGTLEAATIVTTGNGSWSSTVPNAPWPGGIIPDPTDDIIVGDGFTLTVDDPRTCNSLTGGNGSTISVNANLTITTNLAIGDGALFIVGGITLVVNGTTTVGGGTSGSLLITGTAGTKTFAGLVTINPGAVWNETVNEIIVFQGGITNNGTFTANTGNHNFNTNSQTLTGNFLIPTITVTGGANELTNTNSLTVSTALNGGGRLVQGSGATLNIGGTSNITNMTATAAGNTVNYTGADQTVKNVNYENLGLSGSGVKTLQAGTTSIAGDLILSGTVSATGVVGLTIGGDVNIGAGTSFTSGAFTHHVGGDWVNNGSFTGIGSKIVLNGGTQNITGGTTSFDDLQLSGSGTKTFNGNATINNELSIDNGTIANLSNTNTYSSNTLILGGALQGAGTWGSTSSSPAAANQNDTFFSGNGLITVSTGGFTYYSIASADWSAPSTWSTIGFGGPAALSAPGVGDYVIIGDGQTVTVTGNEVCEVLLFDAGTSVTNTLTISSGSLTVSGTVTIPQTVTSGSNILNVGGGTLIAPDIDFTASASGAGHQLTISTGTVTVAGNITGIGPSSTIQFTGAGLLQLDGSIFSSTNGTLSSVAGSTVAYTGGNQTVQALAYNNLTLSGSGTKTLAANTTIGGNLVIGDGVTFVIGGFTTVVTGTTTIGTGTSGTLSITGTAGTKTFTGLVTINPGGVWNEAVNEAITFQGGITNNGTFTAGTAAHTFNTNSQVLTGDFVIPSVTVAGGAVVLTNTNTLTVSNALSGGGRITQGPGAILNIGGASAITNMTATAAGNTVNYTGADQTVKNVNYENLGLSGTGVKTLQAGTTSIAGDLILSGTVSTTGVIGLTIGGDVNIGAGTTFTSGAFTHNVVGNWTNDGTFIGTGSTLVFTGAAQSITGGSTTFNNLILSGSGTKTLGVSPTLAIAGTLTVNNGAVASLSNANTHTVNTLVLGGAIRPSGTWGSTSSAAENQNDTFFSGNGFLTVITGANTFYSIASTAWNVNTTWSNTGFGGAAAAGTPGPDDFVFIGDGFSVTISGDETCSALLFDAGTDVTNTLTISSGSLTVSGTVTIPQTVTSGSNILSVGAGTLTADNVDFTASIGGSGHQLTISTGTVTVAGNITGIGPSSTIQFTGAGLLQVGGSIFSSSNGTLASFAGSTVAYTGGNQTVQALDYNNLTLSGSGTKTLAATTTVGGNLVIGDGVTYVIGGVTTVVDGTTTIGAGTSGTLSITGTAGTKTFRGLVTINPGGVWNEAVNEAVTFQGGITNNGTFTAGTAVHTFNTNSQVLTGNFIIPSVTVAGAAVVLTNTNTLTVDVALSGGGRITQGTGAILNIGGTSVITNMTATAAGNTVNYTGAAQTVKNVNYENLGLSGSGIKTLQEGTTAITGDLTLSGTVSTTGVIGLTIGGNVNIGAGATFTSGAFTHNVAGDWTNDGTFIGTVSGAINFNGVGQNITGGSTTFNDLMLSGSGTKVFGVSIAITGGLSITTGVVADLGVFTTHTANTLILGGLLQSTTGTWGSSGSAAATTNDTYFLSTSSGEITIAIGGNTFYSIASSTWDLNTTWSNTGFGGPAATGTPGPDDFVYIGDGFSVTIAGAETCKGLFFDAGTNVTNTLTISSGSLTVLGTITIPQTVTSGLNILDVGAATLTSDDIDFTASVSGAGHRITISTGTVTVVENITGIGASSTIQFTGAGLLQVGGLIFSSANGTLNSVAGSTVEYTGVAQTVQALGYNNLTLSGSGTKTLAANTTVGGNLVIGDGVTFTIGAFTTVVTGTTTVGGGTSGALSITSATGTKTFTGLVTISNGATWTNTTEAVTFQGGITNNGTFTAGTGVHTFNTNSQTLTGTFSIPSVTVTGAAVVLTNTNTLTVGTALSGTGRITQGSGATLNIGGTSGITNMTATATGNTVNYTGAAQTVKNVNYENLGLSGSGVKTLQAGTTSITGDLTLSGTASTTGVIGLTIGGDVNIGSGTSFTAGSFDHTIGGHWINDGTFNHSNGRIIFSGGSTQNIQGSSVTTFNNLNIAEGPANPDVRLDQTAGVNLLGVLTLEEDATFDADGVGNDQIFTLISSNDDPTLDAAIAPFPNAGAQVQGNVTVQRFMSLEGPNSRIYRYISSPIQNATVADIQNEIPVTGAFTGSSVCTGCTTSPSMFRYDESDISGGIDDGYLAFPVLTNAETLTPGSGYAIFVRGNIEPFLSAGSALWSVRGPVNRDNLNYGVTFTSSGVPANDGWNLVGNPYPSTIDWDAATGWTRANIGGTIYTRNNATGQYAVYTSGSGGLNGGSRYIAMGQGFWVQATGIAPSLETNEQVKSAGTQTTFFRERSEQNILRFALSNGTLRDEAIIHFRDDATDGFDAHADAWKLPNATFNLSSRVEGVGNLAINALGDFNCEKVVPLDVSGVTPGNYQLEFSMVDSFESYFGLVLVDKFLNQEIDLRTQDEYTFQVSTDPLSFGSARFALRFNGVEVRSDFLVVSNEEICSGNDMLVEISNSQPNVAYMVYHNEAIVSQTVLGNGETIQLVVSTDDLLAGESNLKVQGSLPGCAVQKGVTVNVAEVYEVINAQGAERCLTGSVELTVANTTGDTKWYNAIDDVTPLATGSVFQTPELSATAIFYTAVSNSLGCEGIRVPVEAVVYQYPLASISNEGNALISNFETGNEWMFNGTLIPGENGQQLQAVESGEYTLRVTAAGGCVTTDEIQFVFTSLEENPDKLIRVYPNPTVGKLYIEIASSVPVAVKVLDVTGKEQIATVLVVTEGIASGELDLTSNADGLYILHIQKGEQVQQVKIIKTSK
ncbi:MAG: T9SS type A sorting domain-containing protein [Cyclobacteriaceae bacterium]|nr:T9SS type A sorting domain-containing protein [Cyclobacteriaceae bacterium]